MHAPVQVAAPEVTPVSLAEAKAHLRVESTDEDALITVLIAAAVAYADGWSGILGRCLITQSWRQDFDCTDAELRLPLPVIAITEMRVFGADDNTGATVDAANYELQRDERGSFVRIDDDYSWPTDLAETRAVRVTFTAGYGAAAADVPADLRVGLLLLIGHWYQNREAVNVGNITTSLPFGVDALFGKHRVVGV